MASSVPVELDFLGLRPAAGAEHHGGGNGTTTTSSSSSIRGMKTSAIASIGARQLRSVIAGGADTPAPAPKQAPMTLFYNGTVATFDGVSHDKAEAIMKMAMEVTASNGGRVVRGNAFADMPLTRTKSLQQFLQKRKER
ncbi:hypothetical protein BS78_06G074300 [Paspalum vaginatum]|nr:hypothetical protein BS78_06G074300 [Paspalum vaginatum]